MLMRGDAYKWLQVDEDAEPEVIEAAFRRLARKYHPDLNDAPDATEHMREIRQAYEILRDPHLREEYDRRRQAVRLSRAPRSRADAPQTAKMRLSLLGGLVGLDLALRRRRHP